MFSPSGCVKRNPVAGAELLRSGRGKGNVQDIMKMLMGLETQLLKGVQAQAVASDKQLAASYSLLVICSLLLGNIKDKSLVWYDWKSAPKGYCVQPSGHFG